MMAYYETNKFANDRSLFNDEEYTLYVSNLPEELNQHGLLQIFNHYGQVKGHFYRPNTNWAYITYDTYGEAENAIKDLHHTPPLRLKVSFAKKAGFNEIQSANRLNSTDQYENRSTQDVMLLNKPLIQTKGRGKLLDVFKNVEPNLGLPKYTYTADNDLLYPHPSEPYTYNPYENAEPYASTNALWTRGQLSITQDGKRHVSLGRGYTMYEIPYPSPETHNNINKVYEKRTTGLYEYGKDMLQNAIGICKVCLKKTKFTCERCHTFYCSRNCQVANWPQHKIECEAIPALIMTTCAMSTSELNDEVQTSNKNISNIQLPLRRPKKLMDVVSSNEVPDVQNKDANNVSATVCNNTASNNGSKYLHATIDQQNEHKESEIQNTRFEQSYSSFNKSIEKEIHINSTRKSEKSDNLEDTLQLQKFNVNDVTKMEEDISFPTHKFLSKTKFIDVRITVKLNRECWVQKVEDESSIKKLMLDLQYEAEKAQKLEPIVGNIYIVQYLGIWQRAIVTSLNPVKVHYIDYGNDDIVKSNNFREIHKYKNIPRFCAKIRLSEKAYKKYEDLKYDDIISVKMISIDSNKIINVEVQNENDLSMSETVQTNSNQTLNVSTTLKAENKTVATSEIASSDKVPNSLNKLESIVNTVTVGEKGLLEIHAEVKSNTYSLTLLPNNAIGDYEKLLNELPLICAKASECSSHKPNVGDLVCGERIDGDWLRGYILSLQPSLKMAIIDEARVMPINRTVACSEKFSNICAFGAVCEVMNTKYKFKEGDQYKFIVTAQTVNNERDKIEIEILASQNKLRGIVRPWVVMPEQIGLQYAELKSGSEVALTAYQSHILLFARSLDTAELEYYNRMMQNVAKCAQQSPVLKEPPVVGQMVIAKYTDGNYYRAIVTKIQDNKVMISYVDFGNTEVTNIKNLKILSDNLKQLRSCTTKIILKEVPDNIPMTKEVSDYLNHLVGVEIPLTCTFDGIPSKDGVHLKLHGGESVNQTITKLLTPTTKETVEEDKTCYMADDLNTVSLGNIGDTVEVLVLYSIDDGHKYAMCTLDHDLMTHVLDIMPKKIIEYCKESDYYIPREKELCLALYEGGWYRAVCMCRNYTSTESIVFFVDFGNVEFVKHENIRLMPKEFTTPDALANICDIVNLAPTDNKGQYSPEIEKRIKELVVPDNCIQIKIIESDLKSGSYNVELPLVRTKLIEEGLISA